VVGPSKYVMNIHPHFLLQPDIFIINRLL